MDVWVGQCPAAAGAGPHQLPGAAKAARRLTAIGGAVRRSERDLDSVGLRGVRGDGRLHGRVSGVARGPTFVGVGGLLRVRQQGIGVLQLLPLEQLVEALHRCDLHRHQTFLAVRRQVELPIAEIKGPTSHRVAPFTSFDEVLFHTICLWLPILIGSLGVYDIQRDQRDGSTLFAGLLIRRWADCCWR
jgi:hypothetical protein